MAEAIRYKIIFTTPAEKAFDGVKDRRIKTILAARVDKLTEEPEKQGKPLSDNLAGCRSVRAVGQRYRIIYQVQQEKIIVIVLLLGIRKEGDKHDVYDVAGELAHLGRLSLPGDEEKGNLIMSVTAISPIDGRYGAQTEELTTEFSEFALIKYRVQVEVAWLLFLAEQPGITDVRPFSGDEQTYLRSLVTGFDPAQAERVKEIEQTTRHDVKAVEYYLQEKLADTSLVDVISFLHFCCTSEDINNLAYGLMLQNGITQKWLPLAVQMTDRVADLAVETRDIPMLSHTHGQPASPTTLGKELAVFVHRWRRQIAQIDRIEYLGKFSGTVGNYHTHSIAYPHLPWEELSRTFVERLGLTWNPLTTQIESHDYIAELAHALVRFNTILLGFDQDVWTYISWGYFKQRVVKGEVGSSTMPHKVNPINFENSEANLGVSNALLTHLAAKLPVSRLQRDLTDSSALRNVGTAIAHSHVALHATQRGLSVLEVSRDVINRDLDNAWETLAEPVQTVMRRAGVQNAYERLKELTRGAGITQEGIQGFIAGLDLPEEDKQRLLALTPATYTGLASELVRHIQED